MRANALSQLAKDLFKRTKTWLLLSERKCHCFELLLRLHLRWGSIRRVDCVRKSAS